MKFMLIMQGRQTDWETLGTWSPADFQAHIAFMLMVNDELRRTGELVVAEGLDMPANAKVVRATKPDAPIVSDGPFAETKEFLAGFWIVDVESPARAIEIAARISAAPGKGGAPIPIPVEVRQVMQAPDIDG